jgi:hypothetical protein
MPDLALLILIVVFLSQGVSWVGKSVLQELVRKHYPRNQQTVLILWLGILDLLPYIPLINSVETASTPETGLAG